MIDCWEEYKCEYCDKETMECRYKYGVDSGRCKLQEEQSVSFEEYYGILSHDPLDKSATEITPFDVYTPSELGLFVE